MTAPFCFQSVSVRVSPMRKPDRFATILAPIPLNDCARYVPERSITISRAQVFRVEPSAAAAGTGASGHDPPAWYSMLYTHQPIPEDRVCPVNSMTPTKL